MRTITCLSHSYDGARDAVKALKMQASSDHISIISNKDGRQDIEGQGNNAAEGAGTGAGIGAGGLLTASLYAEGVRRGSAVIAAKVEE